MLLAALRAAVCPVSWLANPVSWLKSILLLANMLETAVTKLLLLRFPGLPAAAAAAAAVNWLKFMWWPFLNSGW